jgi:hypothetical protein
VVCILAAYNQALVLRQGNVSLEEALASWLHGDYIFRLRMIWKNTFVAQG